MMSGLDLDALHKAMADATADKPVPTWPTTQAEADEWIEAFIQTAPGGLHALVYKHLYDGLGIRRAQCDKAAADWRKGLKPKP